MIIRILGEGQLSVDDGETTVLNELDSQLASAASSWFSAAVSPSSTLS